MRTIGVIDLRAGRAVHARAGARDQYTPVVGAGGIVIDGDPQALATTYRDTFGIQELYVADLDAILGGAPQDETVIALAGLGVPVWLDAGITSVEQARHALALGAVHVVVGLETLTSFDALRDICTAVGGERVAFSLDLKGGEPLGRLKAAPTFSQTWGPPSGGPTAVSSIAVHAADAGVGAIIVLDLARVGTGSGPDLELLARVRAATPGITLLAGGGVRGSEDLVRLEQVGCDGALVATMLQSVRR